MVKVEIIESEKGWGQRVDEVMEFPSLKEAEDYCREYNNKYNPPMVETPDWYMYARVQGSNELTMLR
jgi:hypothetical protein